MYVRRKINDKMRKMHIREKPPVKMEWDEKTRTPDGYRYTISWKISDVEKVGQDVNYEYYLVTYERNWQRESPKKEGGMYRMNDYQAIPVRKKISK